MMDVLEDIAWAQNVILSCLFAMEPEESVAFAFLLCGYLVQKKKRNLWVHSINAARHCDGYFNTLYAPARKDPASSYIILE
jgi:hypothetical protein